MERMGTISEVSKYLKATSRDVLGGFSIAEPLIACTWAVTTLVTFKPGKILAS